MLGVRPRRRAHHNLEAISIEELEQMLQARCNCFCCFTKSRLGNVECHQLSRCGAGADAAGTLRALRLLLLDWL